MSIKYTKDILEPIVISSTSVAEIIRKLGLKKGGGTHRLILRKIEKYDINISHFLGKSSNLGKPSPLQKPWEEILVLGKDENRVRSIRLRRALIESGRTYKCECGLDPIWKGKELRFQVDHINGNKCDNRPENLRFLCPNCHSQTEGYAGSKGLTDVLTDCRGQRMRLGWGRNRVRKRDL